MIVTDPQTLLGHIDLQFWNDVRGFEPKMRVNHHTPWLRYVEPPRSLRPPLDPMTDAQSGSTTKPSPTRGTQESSFPKNFEWKDPEIRRLQRHRCGTLLLLFLGRSSFGLRLPSQLARAEVLVSMTVHESSGLHCLEHSDPDFRDRVKRGQNGIVAGKSFGCGSSREQAVMALIGGR